MNIAVVMTTYYPENEIGKARLQHAKEVVNSIYDNLYPRPYLLISDDSGEEATIVDELSVFWPSVYCKVLKGPNQGVGASINRALNYIENSTFFNRDWAWIYLPDDLKLTKPIDLTQAIKLLEIGYDFVRLDLPHPNLLCKTKFQQDIGWWLDLDLRCEYSFATRPTLISSKFTERIGPFKEFADSYEVELDYSHRVSDQMLYSAGAVSCNLGNAWQHLSRESEAVGYQKIKV